MIVPIILSGGSGSRLWPLSRETYPKQFLPLVDQYTMLQSTALRIAGLADVTAPLVVCNEEHRFMVAEQLRAVGVQPAAVILEPVGRNTAPAVAVAALHAQNQGADPILLILPADHVIADVEGFRAAVRRVAPHAEAGRLITFGIIPTAPETGYGYIEIAENATPVANPGGRSLFRVASFREKPKPEDAAKYIASGRFLWNSGMFFWRLSSFQNEFGKANPVMAETLEDLTDALMAEDQARAAKIFDALPNISIDYALMEKATHVMVVPGNFIWDDVGAWDALYRTFPTDNKGNIRVGDPVLIDCTDSIIYNAPGQKKMAVGVAGLKDMVVVVNDDAVLVIPKDRAQDVRKIVIALRDRGATQL